jgi:hypothetical protein
MVESSSGAWASGPHRGGIIGTSKNESLSPPE